MDLQVQLELVGQGQKHQGYWGQGWDQLNIQDSFQEGILHHRGQREQLVMDLQAQLELVGQGQ